MTCAGTTPSQVLQVLNWTMQPFLAYDAEDRGIGGRSLAARVVLS